uniref:Uncharacterized protein n=1 Tax=Anas zonorhyncha TaxID=75864 RepID=A0A8B9V7V8_9AVES
MLRDWFLWAELTAEGSDWGRGSGKGAWPLDSSPGSDPRNVTSAASPVPPPCRSPLAWPAPCCTVAGFAAMFAVCLGPAAWVLAHLEDYKKREE